MANTAEITNPNDFDLWITDIGKFIKAHESLTVDLELAKKLSVTGVLHMVSEVEAEAPKVETEVKAEAQKVVAEVKADVEKVVDEVKQAV